MNEQFEVIEQSGVSLLVYSPWWREGIVHGMTMRPFSFKEGVSVSDFSAFRSATGASRIVHMKQVHGDAYFDGRKSEIKCDLSSAEGLISLGELDAMIVPVNTGEHQAFAVASADCVPIVLRGSSAWGLIHAGWRGLANRIIDRVCESFGVINQAVIFPCASGTAYQVGAEVVDAIGASAVVRQDAHGQIYLDTAATARKQLLSFANSEVIISSDVCTISDPRFHSHRRDGPSAGRSITFVVI